MFDIACSVDEKYVPHCSTMLESLFNNNPNAAFRIHLIYKEISSESISKLKNQIELKGSQFKAHKLKKEILADFPVEKFHESCWYRILLGEILPNIDKVLYLDSDIIVLDSLKELFDLDINNYLFAAVVNPLYSFHWERVKKDLGLKAEDEYLNSGVLMINLKSWRKFDLKKKIKEYAKKHPDNLWPEQDALSVVCKGKWYHLEDKWNYQTAHIEAKKDNESVLSCSELYKEKIAILHYTEPNKPWHYLCEHPLKDVYHTYRTKTQWGQYNLEGVNLFNILVKRLDVRWQLKLRKMVKRIFFFKN